MKDAIEGSIKILPRLLIIDGDINSEIDIAASVTMYSLLAQPCMCLGGVGRHVFVNPPGQAGPR